MARPLASCSATSTCRPWPWRVQPSSVVRGGSLTVAVNSDASVRHLGKGDDRPMNPLDDRMAVLAALACVDLVVAFDDDTPRALIVACMPEILVKGGDYTAATTAGAAEVVATGGRFVAVPFAHDRSTTALIARVRGR